ncbi:MAG: alpha/beta hydrolase [Rikenellaceae bacterium]
MKRFRLIIFSLLLTLSSCQKIELLKDIIEELNSKVTILDPSTGETLVGFAADGSSILEIKVDFNSDLSPQTVELAPDGSAYGEFSTSQSSTTLSTLCYELTQEDLDRGYALFYLHSDETVPSALSSSSVATIDYDIVITLESEQSVSKSFEVEVVRPPVIFVHGFGSSSETYEPMLSYITPKGLYIDQALYALDYSATSLASYDVNKSVVPDAIDQTKEAMLQAGYLFNKAVVVGHSMGGVLTRLYMQSCYGVDYRDDILKIVTIDSPFTGTQLANFGVSLADRYPNSPLKVIYNIGAIIDFQVDSEATLNVLNGESLNSVIVPTHIIAATFGDTKSIMSLISEKMYVQALLTFLVQHVATESIYGEDNDLVVPLSSQICGIEEGILKNFVTTYSGEWHCSVHTTEAAATEIIELLETPSTNTKTFSTAGFKPSFLSYDNADFAGITMLESSLSELKSSSDVLITLGLDGDGNIVDMGYESDSEQIEITNTSIAEQYTIGVSSSQSSTLLFYELNL